jgi:asparagine synthase (glutamine-hydrolysing)
LYYAKLANGLAFASEIPTLLQMSEVSRSVDAKRLYEYLRFGLTDHGDGTMFAGIYQVPSAHYMEISLKDGKQHPCVRYWQIAQEPTFQGSFADAAEALRAKFLESIRLHLRSDVPVGAALSGGIDSSAIVGAIRHLEPNADLHVFSYFADSPEINEESWSRLAANASRAILHPVHASAHDLVEDLDRLIAAQGEPFGSTAIYAQYRVFKAAREAGIKVMLDGQGAD